MDLDKLRRTIGTAMRMLDNVIDLNYYSVGKARNSNFKHRPVGLGIMAFQDCLHALRIPYASADAVEFSDRSMEAIAHCAYWASTSPEAVGRGPRWPCYHSRPRSQRPRGMEPNQIGAAIIDLKERGLALRRYL